jgi:hypothetical protein
MDSIRDWPSYQGTFRGMEKRGQKLRDGENGQTTLKHALDTDDFTFIIENRSMKDKMVLITSTKGGQNEHR